MSDLLLEMGQKPWFRSTVNTLGLPLPMPQALDRADGAIVQKELAGKVILSNTSVSDDVKAILADAGASAASASSKEKVNGLLFDGRSAQSPKDLQDMYNFFHANIRRLGTNSRVLVLARAVSEDDPASAAAAAAACIGFAKSMAKEIGKKGAIANVVFVEDGAEHNLAGPVRFFLSARSTYVNGQPVVVSKTAKSRKKESWEQPLKGQVALVTGAARGIGEVIARRLAEEGAKVIGLDVGPNAEPLNAVCDSIGGIALVLDITEDGAAQKILDAANAAGGLDIVVNNAGITRDKTLANMNDKFWNMAIDVNLGAALEISEAFFGCNQIRWVSYLFVFNCWYRRKLWPDQLWRSQSRSDWSSQTFGTEICGQKGYDQRCCTRLYRNSNDSSYPDGNTRGGASFVQPWSRWTSTGCG